MTPDRATRDPRVALVHDYFTQRGGAEKVAGRLARILSAATIHTSVFDSGVLPPSIPAEDVRASSLQRLRRAGAPLRVIAPLLPVAFAGLDLGDTDVVLSSSSAFAHHVRPGDAFHVCYCHTPPRFLWKTDEYFRDQTLQSRLLAPGLAAFRRLDAAAARRVDVYVANSRFTAERIWMAYGRTARVIHPPVATTAFAPTVERSGRFLVVARLKRHKRIDLAIAAAGLLGVGLDIIGEGPDRARLERLAGPTVRLVGWRPDDDVRRAMATCEALLVPGLEDFGLTTAEVQAAGRPPIAFAAGGALEIVRDGETGFLVAEQTPEALAAAMCRASAAPLDPSALVRSARRFDDAVFERAIRDLVGEALGRAPAAVPDASATPIAATSPIGATSEAAGLTGHRG